MSVGEAREAMRVLESDASYAVLPRAFRPILRFRGSPLWLGLATAVVALIADGGVLRLTGFYETSDVSPATTVPAQVAYALYFGWVPVAVAYLVRGAERDARNLASALGKRGVDREELRRNVLAVGPGPIALGMVAALAMAAYDLWIFFGVIEGVRYTPASASWIVLREVAVDVGLFGVLGWAVGAALRLSRLARESAPLDLLGARPFEALARNGTRLALFWLLIVAIALPMVVTPPGGLGVLAWELLLASLAVMSVLAGVALVLPTAGGRHAMRAAKREELARVREQIATARRDRDDARLPGLLAWEERVAKVSEWPIDARAVRRVGLYLLIPFGSWVGGALVERLVDVVLG